MPTVSALTSFIWSHPSNRNQRFHALGKALTWQIYKRITGRHWDLEVFNSMRLRVYPDSSSASLALYCNGRPDYHEMGFMQHYLRPGDGFVDVGANIGVYTLLAASLVGEAGRIDAFEPGLKARMRFEENLLLNKLKNIYIHPVSVGEKEGIIQFTQDHDTTNQMVSTVSEAVRGTPESNTSILEVPCVRLDKALAGQHYAMGKIDIEGAEPLAMQGMEQRLKEIDPPVWLLELNGSLRNYGFTEQEFADWLRERGYDLALYDADRRELCFSKQPWSRCGNVFAITRAAQDEIKARINGIQYILEN